MNDKQDNFSLIPLSKFVADNREIISKVYITPSYGEKMTDDRKEYILRTLHNNIQISEDSISKLRDEISRHYENRLNNEKEVSRERGKIEANRFAISLITE